MVFIILEDISRIISLIAVHSFNNQKMNNIINIQVQVQVLLVLISILSFSFINRVHSYTDGYSDRDMNPACDSPHLQGIDIDHPFFPWVEYCNNRVESKHKDALARADPNYRGQSDAEKTEKAEKEELLQSKSRKNEKFGPLLRRLATATTSSGSGSSSGSSSYDVSYLDDFSGGASYLDDFSGGDVITIESDIIVVGAGVAGCEFTSTWLENPINNNKNIVLIGSGPNVQGQNDTQVTIWKVGSSMPVHNLHSNDKFTRDVRQWQYPEAQVLGGASVINPQAMIKPPCEYWNDWNYTSWKCPQIRHIVNGVENYKGAETPSPSSLLPNHGHQGHTVITTFPAEPETRKWEQAFHDVLPEVPIVTNQDAFELGVGDIGRGIDVDSNGEPIRQNIYIKTIYNKTLPGNEDYRPNLKVYSSFRCLKLTYGNRGNVNGVHCLDLVRGRIVKFMLKNRNSNNAIGKVVLAMDAVRIPPFLERSGIGNRTIIEKFGIRVRHENSHVGENLMSDYNVPGFSLSCVSGCPQNHSSGHTGMAFFRSPLQKARNAVTGLKTLDCQVGYRYFLVNGYSVSNFQNVYTTTGSVHMATADIITDDEIVYNRLFDSPDDSKPLGYMMNITRQVIERLATHYGMILTELSPSVAVTGKTPEEIAIWASKVGVPQYHNHGTTAIGKVVDENQLLLADPTVMIIGGSVIPKENWLWTHSSHYFALISGRKAALYLISLAN